MTKRPWVNQPWSRFRAALRQLLADVFALYVKTKNFHWHMGSRHFRDYHELLDKQAAKIFAMTDAIAERARNIGEASLKSVCDIAGYQRLEDNNGDGLPPSEMLDELRNDNRTVTGFLHGARDLCDEHRELPPRV